jgi:hypothetical protein
MKQVSVVSVGWIVLKDGLPFRPSKSGYSWQNNLTNPPRVYNTESKAKTQAKKVLGSVVEVFYEGKEE